MVAAIGGKLIITSGCRNIIVAARAKEAGF
jgi:hypothetical protein